MLIDFIVKKMTTLKIMMFKLWNKNTKFRVKMLFKFCIENKFTLFLSENTLKCEICMFLKSENTTLKK